jgi:hypothetical protein
MSRQCKQKIILIERLCQMIDLQTKYYDTPKREEYTLKILALMERIKQMTNRDKTYDLVLNLFST